MSGLISATHDLDLLFFDWGVTVLFSYLKADNSEFSFRSDIVLSGLVGANSRKSAAVANGYVTAHNLDIDFSNFVGSFSRGSSNVR